MKARFPLGPSLIMFFGWRMFAKESVFIGVNCHTSMSPRYDSFDIQVVLNAQDPLLASCIETTLLKSYIT